MPFKDYILAGIVSGKVTSRQKQETPACPKASPITHTETLCCEYNCDGADESVQITKFTDVKLTKGK